MVKEIDGNVFDSTANVIAHQVNCMGVMGSGIAKVVAKKYPEVECVYTDACKRHEENPEELLGDLLLVTASDSRKIANLFGQANCGPTGRFTNYEAVYRSLENLAEQLDPEVDTIALPYKMSSDRGGADWNVIRAMIESALKDFNVEIWKLPAKD